MCRIPLSLLVLGLASVAAVRPALSADLMFRGNGTQAALVELYSSEGCSSCPPAEAWIGKLKMSPGLWTTEFPLVFHVDYWDGLGWPDRFARPAFTQRQRTYAAQLGQDSVYTPEFVVGGREWRGWFNGGSLSPVRTSGELALTVADQGKSVEASYQLPASASPASADTLNVALLGLGIVSDVRRGENGGRQLQHDFVVLDFMSRPLQAAGAKLVSGPVHFASGPDQPKAIVAWISAPDGSIRQVAGGWLESPLRSASLR